MKIDRQKLLLTMARACMSPADLQTATQLPRPTLNNAMGGRGIRPVTLGKIAKALSVDPEEIIEKEV